MEAKGSGYHTMQQVVDNIIKYKNFNKTKNFEHEQVQN